MLKLKLQYFGHFIQRADSLEKTLMLGKFEGKRRRGWQRMSWLDGITGHEFELTQESEEVRCATVYGVIKSRTELRN